VRSNEVPILTGGMQRQELDVVARLCADIHTLDLRIKELAYVIQMADTTCQVIP